MRTLALLAALLTAQPGAAAAWCPMLGVNDATDELPSATQVFLSETGDLSLSVGSQRISCAPAAFLGDYFCDQQFSSSCVGDDGCTVSLVFVPKTGGKHDQIGLDDMPMPLPDLSRYELWLVPEYTVYSELHFQPCTEQRIM